MTEYLINRIAKIKIKTSELKRLCQDMPEEGNFHIDSKASRLVDRVESVSELVNEIIEDLEKCL